LIAKDKPVYPCEGYQVQPAKLALIFINLLAMAAVSVLMVAIALTFEELHTLFGYLLMLYNVANVCFSIANIGIVAMEFLVAVNSHAICYFISIVCTLAGLSFEVFGTCIFHSFAYIVYRSEKLRTIKSEDRKR